jgi:hypothetical protein
MKSRYRSTSQTTPIIACSTWSEASTFQANADPDRKLADTNRVAAFNLLH